MEKNGKLLIMPANSRRDLIQGLKGYSDQAVKKNVWMVTGGELEIPGNYKVTLVYT